MELINIKKDTHKGLVLIKPKYKFFSLDFPTAQSQPKIILTEEEAREKSYLIPNKISIWDKIFHNGQKCLAYCVIEGIRVPILLTKD